jgi:hypothetical protein
MKHTELIERLRNTPNWQRESYGNWKDGTVHYDRAPFEAADAIEALQSTLARIEKKVDYLIAERDALKLDAERYRKVKPLFKWDNEGGHGIWTCSIRDDLWGDSIDVSVDAMKGAT